MKTVSRITLDDTLLRLFRRLKPGLVLDVGAKNSPYLRYIPQKKYLRLDINPDTKPDIVSDVHKIDWRDNYFDTVIATEVLEHLYNPQKAIAEINRVLKPGGICILSAPFIYVYHPDPKDYYRFSRDSLEYLFRKFKKVEIIARGNRVQVLWQILSSAGLHPILAPLNPLIAKINFTDPYFPLGFVVLAQK